MNEQDKTTPGIPKAVKSVEVHQHKASLFRVVHADGMWCSVNAYNDFHLTFYSERHPIPTSIFFSIDEKGAVIREEVEKRETKRGWFREMEVDIVLNLNAARGVYEGLGNFIKMAEKFSKPQTEQAK